MMKQCNTCANQYLPTLEFFPPNKGCRNGLDPMCRACRRAYTRKWKQANSERLSKSRREDYARRYGPIQREKERVRKDGAPLRFRANIIRSGMADRARKKGLPFDAAVFTIGMLTTWMAATPNCPCCGVMFDYGFRHDGMKKNDSPSIDRIVPGKGYVVGNVALICWRCNNLKRDATAEELETVVRWMRSHGN